jgi:hypothetical protein
MFLFIGGGMTASAYWFTPYIKIRGKIYAFHIQDSLPDPPDGTPPPGSDDPDYDPAPDSYSGTVTAKKAWWVLVFFMTICVFTVIIRDGNGAWMAPSAAAIVVVSAAVYGYGDASWGYSVARGQRLQFAIVSVVTVGVFTVFYLGGYRAGKRWPLRRTQDMEYRAHPHHQKRHP